MSVPDFRSDEKGRPIEVVRFSTDAGTDIYLLPVETFPGHLNNIYVVLRDGEETLFDAGSGLPASNAQLEARFDELRETYGLSIGLSDLRRVVVSHAHIDHFGGVHELAARGLEVCIHELDARVLAHFEERILIASKDIAVFLVRAGVELARRTELAQLYAASKEFFRSIAIDRRLRNGDVLPGDMQVIHAPGHCPGLILLRVDDLLLTSDHILARITPNQMPQSITPFTGLENYLRSLDKVSQIEGITLGLGGHEAPMTDVRGRIMEIAAHHRRRLQQCLDLAKEPHTIREFADGLFGDQSGYGRLLAYTEAGAHVEYLHQLGQLTIANLDEVALEENPVIRYQAR